MKSVLVTAALIVGCIAGLSALPGVRGWVHSMIPGLGIEGASPSSTKERLVESNQPKLPNKIPSGQIKGDSQFLNDIPEQPEGRLVDLEGSPSQGQVSAVDPYVQLAQATSPIVRENSGATPNSLQSRVAQSGTLGIVPQDGFAVPSASKPGVLVDNSAQLKFVEEIIVSAQADGVITNLFVDDGKIVSIKAGIYELDSRLAKAEIEIQTKEVEQAKLKAKDDSNVRYAKAAERLAKKEYEISNKLVVQGAEDAMTNEKKGLEVQKANLQIIVSENEKDRDAIAVGVAEGKLSAAKVQLDLRTFVAPWDGFVSEVEKHRYEYARAGEKICKLTDMRKLRVTGTINVTTPTPPHKLLNSPATISIEVAPGLVEKASGVVGFVAPGSTISNRYPYWVEIDNQILPDGQYLFRGGMKALVEITPRD